MIDLTPLDVRKKRGDFRRILRGYDPEEVDTFMDLVAERFEELVRENLSLSEKTEVIENQLRALEGREKAVQDALVTAQKLREDVKDQAQRDVEVLHEQASRSAELLKAEAEAEIDRRLRGVESQVLERRRAIEELERSRLKFLKSFRGMLERELDAVEVEESRRPLEDNFLDLELRGWDFGGDSVEEHEDEEEEFEPEAPEASEGERFEPEPPQAPEEEELELEAPEAPEAPEMEVELVAETAEIPLPDPALEEVEAEVPGEEIPGGALGGFETQLLEAAARSGLDILQGEEDVSVDEKGSADEEVSGGDGGDEASTPQEPKWLFSLLKKEEEGGREV